MIILNDFTMGNEESHYPKYQIEDEAIEVTESWTLHYAKAVELDGNVCSAFVSQAKVDSSHSSLLEKLSKNLMLHRHPCIVKYISHCNKGGKFQLITEEVKPLSLVLANYSALQICMGIYRVLNAIVFLHDKAQSSHCNICCASIYVSADGTWKLGGLEFLKKFSEVSPSYLQQSRASRYERGVPPEEDNFSSNSTLNPEAIDKFAFGVLVEELLKKKSTDEIPFLLEFKDYCKRHLQASDPGDRKKLSELLGHSFFNHEFIRIFRFLVDLPLKSSTEKEQFFRDLTEQLSSLPEDVVACQLASLLLSRVVLLDTAAQKHLLPVLFLPRTDDKPNGIALFSEEVFKKFISPKILKIFCVRDVQIRLILLNHFNSFCNTFTREELSTHILPELLVGIKDCNDHLVSMTLKALSQLVIILGAATVIGGKRRKLFSDGNPKSLNNTYSIESKTKLKSKNLQVPMQTDSEALFQESSLPERFSPDGGEDNSTSSTLEDVECDNENWSDWDISGDKTSPKVSTETFQDTKAISESIEPAAKNLTSHKTRGLPDINTLDIKSSGENGSIENGDIDFFHDMEPVISKTQIISLNSSKTKFDIESDDPGGSFDGWGEDWELEEEGNS